MSTILCPTAHVALPLTRRPAPCRCWPGVRVSAPDLLQPELERWWMVDGGCQQEIIRSELPGAPRLCVQGARSSEQSHLRAFSGHAAPHLASCWGRAALGACTMHSGRMAGHTRYRYFVYYPYRYFIACSGVSLARVGKLKVQVV